MAGTASRFSRTLSKFIDHAQFNRMRALQPQGVTTVHCSFNNTIVTVATLDGRVVVSKSGGTEGYKRSQRSTPEAAAAAAAAAAEAAVKQGVKVVKLHVKGPAKNRQSAIRGLVGNGLMVSEIKDTTPLPYNGVRAKKARRI